MCCWKEGYSGFSTNHMCHVMLVGKEEDSGWKLLGDRFWPREKFDKPGIQNFQTLKSPPEEKASRRSALRVFQPNDVADYPSNYETCDR